jgi:hypothetical protein
LLIIVKGNEVYGARSAPGKFLEVFTAREARRGIFLKGCYGARSAPGNFEGLVRRAKRAGGFF